MNQGFTQVKASSIGAVLDCNLATGTKIGGGTATDNTAVLNAFLATASATNPLELILDGPTLVTGLILATAGYTKISGTGPNSGIFIESGSNSDGLNNGKITPFDPQTTPPAQAGYVELSDFQINGNRGNGTTGNSTTGDPRGVISGNVYWYCNINLANLSRVRITNMYLYDSPAYEIRLNNCSDFVIEKNTVINPNATFTGNQDGVHIDGPWTDGRIAFNFIDNNLSDDAIALNAHEGYGGAANRTVVIGNTITNCLTALRVYGSSGTITAPVYQTTFSDNTGNVSEAAILLGVGLTYNADIASQVLTGSNNTFVATGPFLLIQGNAGVVSFVNCWLNSPTTSNSFISGQFAGSVISDLTLSTCGIYRNTLGNTTTTPMVGAAQALTLTRLNINDFQIVNEQGQSYAALAALLAMTNVTIGQLFIGAFNYQNVTALADSYTNITAINGLWQPESNIQSKTAAYTLLPTDRTVLASTTAGSFAVALPANAYAGQKHTIKNTGTANTLTVTGTVDGTANPTLATLAKITVEYDGTHWWSV